MVVLRIRVPCTTCGKEVDRADARVVKQLNQRPQYECFHCYKEKKWLETKETEAKRKLYCNRCRYTFSAKSLVCPYCGKGDQVVSKKISFGKEAKEKRTRPF